MATLKHIASKNSDYSAAEAYLIYQHDEFTGKQLLDEQCRPMLRESYILDTLECGDFSFATACLLANRKYKTFPVIPPSSVPTRMGTTIRETSMSTS